MEKKENIIRDKTYDFALKVISTFKELQNRREFVLSKQLIRSATSVGANIEEGVQGQSKKDFIHKFSIAQKEITETIYWLRLLRDSDYLPTNNAEPLIESAKEIQRIITAIIITAKKNEKNAK